MFPLTCMLVCAKCAILGTRDRGCSAHPAFPAPSALRVRRRSYDSSGEIAPREREVMGYVSRALRSMERLRNDALQTRTQESGLACLRLACLGLA